MSDDATRIADILNRYTKELPTRIRLDESKLDNITVGFFLFKEEKCSRCRSEKPMCMVFYLLYALSDYTIPWKKAMEYMCCDQ